MTSNQLPQNNVKFAIDSHISSTGDEFFPKDSPKTYGYDSSSRLSTVTAIDPISKKVFIKTLTYGASGITSDSGWVKQ